MELILNTKEDCFLCLQTILSEEKNELGLRNICRFLQINTCDVLLQGQKTKQWDPSNLLQDTKHNFSVNLCSQCYVVAEKLSSLIHDLEMARLQVNYYSEVLQKILEKAELATSPTSAATVKIGIDNLATVDTRVVNYLRNNVKLKCSAHNKKALQNSNLPLVRLNRLTKETVATLTKKCGTDRPTTDANTFADSDHSVDNSSSNNPNDNEDDYSNSISSLYNSSDNDDYSDSISSDDASILTSVSVSASRITNDDGTRNFVGNTNLNIHDNTLVQMSANSSVVLPSNTQIKSSTRIFKLIKNTSCDPTKIKINPILGGILTKNCYKKGSGKKYGCPFCDTITLKRQPMKHHLTRHHVEKLLSVANRNQVPDDLFEKLCHHALEKELGKCEMLPTTGSDGKLVKPSSAHYICYICKTSRVRSILQHHLVTCHTGNLVETLDSLPKDGNFEIPMNALTAFGLPDSRVPGNKIRKRANPTSAKLSQRRICCPHCKNAYDNFSDLRRHMLRFYPDQLFLSVQPAHQNRAQFAASCRKIFQRETVEYTNTAKGQVVSRQCAYCTVVHRYKFSYLYHLVRFHKEVLTEKIKVMANEDDENASYPVVEAKEEMDWTTQESNDDFGDLLSEEEIPGVEMDLTPQEPDDEFWDRLSGEEEQEEKNELKDVSSPETKKCSNQRNTKHTSIHSLSIKISENLAVTESTEYNSHDPDVVEPENKCPADKKDTLVPPSNLEVGVSIKDPNAPQDSDIIIIDMEEILADCVTRYFLKQDFSSPPHYHHLCTICKTSVRMNQLKRHVVVVHLEKLLSFAKRADVPEEAFPKMCCQVLKRETERCKQVLSKNAKGTTACQSPHLCYVCRKTTTGTSNLRNHFVTSHADILGKALDELQQEGTYSISSAGGPHDRTMSNLMSHKRSSTSCLSEAQIPCRHCSKSFLTYYKLRIHLLCCHPEQLFLSIKPPHQSLSQFADYSQKVFQNEAIMCEKASKKANARVYYQCTFCQNTFWQKTSCIYHLVYHHKKIFAKKIEAFLVENYADETARCSVEERKEEQDGRDGLTEQSDDTMRNLRFHKRRPTMSRLSKAQTPCLHCSKSFLGSYKLRIHMLRCHPDQLFLSVKPAHQSLSQFADSCQEVLQNETIMSEKESNKAQLTHAHHQCVYCKNSYRHKEDYLHHLVYRHKKILAEKIEDLLVEDYADETAGCPVEERKKEQDRFCGPTEKSDSGSEDDSKDSLKKDDCVHAAMVQTKSCNENNTEHLPVLDEWLSDLD